MSHCNTPTTLPILKVPEVLTDIILCAMDAETADLLIFHIHGIPSAIVSDRGPQFISHVWKAFCYLPLVSLSSGFHPQTNGQTERANLEAALRCVTATNPSSWSTHLAWVEYAHNALTSATTGLSPFEVSLGYQPPLFPSWEEEIAAPRCTFGVVGNCGGMPALLCFAQQPGTNTQDTGPGLYSRPASSPRTPACHSAHYAMSDNGETPRVHRHCLQLRSSPVKLHTYPVEPSPFALPVN
ncbi:uncharacterized protein LOC122877902 [Siniperca chuatsi]|uniref:uncharacterized protein LOC122877902 n=1 Tax=Siniperca chuatsi TaxID=119488 RepID=UPI001CE1AAD2|nr:uncharacterized protein LOC122877902 [Siniperca chuatsi]